MAQLDRFLNLLVTNNGSGLVLAEGDVAKVTIKDSARPVMKQPLTSAQILTLVREIAPAGQPHALDAKGAVSFDYSSADGAFEVSLTQNGKIVAQIKPKALAKNGAKPSAAPASAVATEVVAPPPATPSAPPAPRVETARPESTKMPTPRVNATGNRALDRIETLLRTLVGNKASDLHLRSGSPPMLRLNGEIEAIPNEAILSSAEIDEMLGAVMLEQNRDEFKEINDTDFAHEIPGIARFRGNALRERKGTGAVFRAVPASVVTVEQMGISQEVQRLCHLTKGLVLVTGPTGGRAIDGMIDGAAGVRVPARARSPKVARPDASEAFPRARSTGHVHARSTCPSIQLPHDAQCGELCRPCESRPL
jgi:twitching motility protein PilT